MTGEGAQRRAQEAQRAITSAMSCPLCPEVTAEAGAYLLARMGKRPKYRTGTEAARARAAELTQDPAWRGAVMAWIDAYNQEHRHGPPWHVVCAEPQLWAQEVPRTIRQLMLKEMLRTGYLQGSQIPYGLRVSKRHADSTPVSTTAKNPAVTKSNLSASNGRTLSGAALSSNDIRPGSDQEYAFYAKPENQTPQGPAHRRV